MYFFQRDGVCFWEDPEESYCHCQSTYTLTVIGFSIERLSLNVAELFQIVESSDRKVYLWGQVGVSITASQEYKLIKEMRLLWGDSVLIRKCESSGLISHIRLVSSQSEPDVLEKMSSRHHLILFGAQALSAEDLLDNAVARIDGWITPKSICELQSDTIKATVGRAYISEIWSVVQFFGSINEIRILKRFFEGKSHTEVNEDDIPGLVKANQKSHPLGSPCQ